MNHQRYLGSQSVEWNGGMEWWNGILKWISISLRMPYLRMWNHSMMLQRSFIVVDLLIEDSHLDSVVT